MLAKTFGSAVHGIHAITIQVEVTVRRGAKYFLVGLPDNAVKEGQHRIESAIRHCGYRMLRKKIIINLAPADIRKEGSAYDLPVAIGILAATKQIPTDSLHDFLIMGELSLDGTIRPIKGALPISLQGHRDGFKGLILPEQNAQEAAVTEGFKVFGMKNLSEVAGFLSGKGEATPFPVRVKEMFDNQVNGQNGADFTDVKGQENVKRAMEIAAAGGHNIIMIGPPGAGKTMLARRLPGILPPLTLEEALETTKIHSVAGKIPTNGSIITGRPFRSPHHTVSDVALVGGGTIPQPGEISLAHHGVLFLDELPEFKRSVLEVLRQPMEERRIVVSRARFTVEYPSSFMLVASMNPCPCGFYNHPEKECVCAAGTVQKYLSRISGPLLDRIDLHIEVTPVPFSELSKARSGESSSMIRERVIRARKIQEIRFEKDTGIYCNAQMETRHLRDHCGLDEAGTALLKAAMEKLGLSARAYDRILKVSRTIADLAESTPVGNEHLAEAIQYRSLDREGWAG